MPNVISEKQIVIDLQTGTVADLTAIARHLTNLAGDREREKQARMIQTPVGSYDPIESSDDEIRALIPLLEEQIAVSRGNMKREKVMFGIAPEAEAKFFKSYLQGIAESEQAIKQVKATLIQRQRAAKK